MLSSSSAVPSGRDLLCWSAFPGDESPGCSQMCLQHISALSRDVTGRERSLVIVMLSPDEVPEGSPAIAGRFNFRNLSAPVRVFKRPEGTGDNSRAFQRPDAFADTPPPVRPEGTLDVSRAFQGPETLGHTTARAS